MGICHKGKKVTENPITITTDPDAYLEGQYNLDDSIFKSIREEENKILNNEYDSKVNYFGSEIYKHLYGHSIDFVTNITNTIILKEGGKEIFNQRIQEEIEIINNDEEKFKIKYLTIMVIGQTGTGKSTLINSLLKLEGKYKAPTGIVNIVTTQTRDYMNKKVPYLRLVDTRGIELSKIANITAIGDEAEKFMKNQKKPNKSGEVDFNNLVHCIWYCVESNRFQEAEMDLIQKLKETYQDNKIPIIIVMTQAINEERYEGIKQFLETKNYDFVKVLAKGLQIHGGQKIEAFGLDNLVDLTLEKCKKAFKGDMKAVMIENMSDYIKQEIQQKNREIHQSVKLDQEGNNFKEYIYDLYKCNLNHFLSIDDLKKETSSLISSNSSEFVKHKQNFFLYSQNLAKKTIENNISEYANIFLDIQAKKQIKNKKSVKNENRRDKDMFINTSTKYLIYKFNLLSYKYYSDFTTNTINKKIMASFAEGIDFLINDSLNQNKVKDSISKIYEKKFNDFEKIVEKCRQKNMNAIIKE